MLTGRLSMATSEAGSGSFSDRELESSGFVDRAGTDLDYLDLSIKQSSETLSRFIHRT